MGLRCSPVFAACRSKNLERMEIWRCSCLVGGGNEIREQLAEIRAAKRAADALIGGR